MNLLVHTSFVIMTSSVMSVTHTCHSCHHIMHRIDNQRFCQCVNSSVQSVKESVRCIHDV